MDAFRRPSSPMPCGAATRRRAQARGSTPLACAGARHFGPFVARTAQLGEANERSVCARSDLVLEGKEDLGSFGGKSRSLLNIDGKGQVRGGLASEAMETLGPF